MSQSTNAIKMLARAGIEALRSSEAVSVLPSTLNIATDPEDDLYCPGVDDPPSKGLVNSIRNGWIKGNSIFCVNRGTKDAPIPFIVAGRSRKKATEIVNAERAAEGLAPILVDIVFVSPEDAYRVMLLENNRQDRSPLFNPRRWQQHRRVYSRRIGKVVLDASDLIEARREFAALIDVDEGTISVWETMLEAPSEVLAMVDRGDISATDAKELVRHAPAAERVEKAVQIAARKTNESTKGLTKKEHREVVLGKSRPITPKQIRVMTVRATALGLDENIYNRNRNGEELQKALDAAMADGFALLGKLLTGEIKAEDLPDPLREIAIATLKK